jgi:IS30 family transposase
MLLMKRRPMIFYTEADKALMWDRWQKGDSMNEIARGLGRYHSSVQRILTLSGGVRPAPRKRSRLALTLTEREEISRGLVAGDSLRTIAEQLGRSPSTISREVRRNRDRRGYRAVKADRLAWDRSRRPKPCKLAENRALARRVAKKLKASWSPEQIAGWLKRTYPYDEYHRVSHETIYRSLFIQTRGALKKELTRYLRKQQSMRRGRHATRKRKVGKFSDAVSIRERPASVEDRALPGHWEGDLLFGGRDSYIATLVERHTRYVMLVKVTSADSETVIKALIKHAHKLPKELYQSLTWDRGSEIADHARFTLATDIKVYLCDPQSPWQRGSNENTNGLLRQYFPKGTDLSIHSQAKLNAVARELNGRPRKTLDFETPAERFNACVASIG